MVRHRSDAGSTSQNPVAASAAGGDGRLPVLFLACSSFSGSTLLSFLLNTHPEITTVGHTIGWRYTPGERFYCSCSALLEACAFWRHVADAFAAAGLPFSFHDFGTRYQIVGNDRLNRYLTAQLPRLRGDRVEALRDRLVAAVPAWRRRLALQDRANETLMRAAMAYSGARVYVDNTHSPYRLWHLARGPGLDLSVAYLVRDIRGTVYSYMKNHGWDVRNATRIWLDEQANILRIGARFPRFMTVHYDDLCERTEDTLAALHAFVGVAPHRFDGDFGAVEHHILGNVMRFGAKRIAKDERWRSALDRRDIAYIETAARRFIARRPGHPLGDILRRHLNDD
ncbi:MAG: hypothetical protein D6826_09695 [Alphaproteobacteria bacterium]|nr:MAG: hypothetical protein D6826_09695 [Alphaproteobacteria bacterium]